ncbi:unnamed protein product [Aureobasidium vineae]|uniref:GRF-type domain-containing protein n=1 Tax=Aureobasidium vineae TaxID=2773715 RepID=A0A9N8JL05_9PEZI|nr:unnamed protein product [Aureobasidium vineae]
MASMFKKVPKTDAQTTSPVANNSNRGSAGGRRGTFTRRPGRQKLTGLFADGIWHCDCDSNPRLPAERFQVKKESANKGRWFYACQNGNGRKCGFFLWQDPDAKLREEAALLGNSRTEPKSTADKSLYPIHQSSRTMQSSPNSTSTLSHPSSTLKRPFSDVGLGDDADTNHDSLPWSLSGQEEVELLDAPETPRKAVKFDGLATPATSVHRKLPWLDPSVQVPSTVSVKATPSKESAQLSLPTSSTYKLAVTQHAVLTPQVTPSPSRFRDPSADTSSPLSTLNEDVFAALKDSGVTLPSSLTSKLREVLTRHELRTHGVVKGREITRLALKAREAKIVELQATITSLEAERNVDHARITRLEWEKDMLVSNEDFDTEL